MIFTSEDELDKIRKDVVSSAVALHEKMNTKKVLVNDEFLEFESHVFEFLSRVLIGDSLLSKVGTLTYSISQSQILLAFFTQCDNIMDKKVLIEFLKSVPLTQ